VTVTTKQLNAVLRTLREVGYTGLDEHEAQIVQAFNDGDLNVVEEGLEVPMNRVTADREFQAKCEMADHQLERGGGGSWAREIFGEPYRETETD
jgi:hypothetical protein